MASKRGKLRQREAIVRAMARIMWQDFRAGRTGSAFAYEGALVAAWRAELCLAGTSWPAAHRAARALVDDALKRTPATRPSWADGQHAATGLLVKDAACRQCGTPLRARQVHFCSRACRHRWWRDFNVEAA